MNPQTKKGPALIPPPAAMVLGILLMLAVPPAPVRGEEYQLPPQNTWRRLYNRAEIIKAEVSREIEADKSRWIDAYADLHTCTDLPLSVLRETILDFESYPQIFERNRSMQVIYEDGAVYHDMVAGIEVFGVFYSVRFRQLVTVIADEPNRLLVDYSYVWGDGKVKAVRGAWYFEELPGTNRCYVRYIAASRMIQRFALQRFVMSMLIKGET
ncbi:MAG: SRPBCC family protein, partial [Treponema sp.]|nr:SRPBCC family protein [Treponema sp.]